MERRHLSRTSRNLWAASLLAILTGFGPAEAAPQQLLNKTIVYSYSYRATMRAPSGKIFDENGGFSHTTYISSSGRIFDRTTKSGYRPIDADPNSTRGRTGETRSTRFEGNKLVEMFSYASGASRVVVSFDPAFSSCTVDIVMGKGGGNIKRIGRDGIMYEHLSHSFSGNSCSIRDGNSFAN